MSSRFRHFAMAAVTLSVVVFGLTPVLAQEEAASIPWTEEGLKEAFTVGTKMVYSRSGTNKKGEEVGGTHTLEVTEVTELIVSFDDSFEDPGRERASGLNIRKWEDAFFLFSFSGGEIEFVGTEQVETPAGTFDTVVVETTHDFFNTKHTYYLIPDQPGVFAKVVDHGKTDEEANIVMTLQEVVR